MSSFLPSSIQKLIEEFSKLPGVGPKSAQRLTMHLLYAPDMRSLHLAEAIGQLKKNIRFCRNCWNIAEDDLCKICSDPARNQRQICVVEEILDTMALEKTGEYRGVYHVLHGVLSPVDGIGPEQLKITELVERLTQMKKDDTDDKIEVILATNPTLEGETTAMYLLRFIKSEKLRLTRIARGLPAGGDLDYADEVTLARALQGRVAYE